MPCREWDERGEVCKFLSYRTDVIGVEDKMEVSSNAQLAVSKLFNSYTRTTALSELKPENLENTEIKRAFNCAVFYFEPKDIEVAVKLGLMAAPA